MDTRAFLQMERKCLAEKSVDKSSRKLPYNVSGTFLIAYGTRIRRRSSVNKKTSLAEKKKNEQVP